MVMLPDARAPEGLRLYAIGDVHGCVDLLAEAHARIAADLARRLVADWRIVHLGDYVDRGPDSAGVLRLLMEYRAAGRAEFLLGNHDAFLLDFLADPENASFDVWMANGGIETMASLGIDGVLAAYSREQRERLELRSEVLAALPPDAPAFLSDLLPMVRHGDYAFAHAGVRPGVPLDRQEVGDLIWIRDRFLGSRADHGAVVVHGHTPTERVEVRRNRIGIDTGAVFTGTLTCLVLEGAERAILGGDGLSDLPAPD